MDDDPINAAAQAVYEVLEGPVNNQDFTRQMRQWALAQEIARAAIVAYEATRPASANPEKDR